jgi:Tfp pilus assembly protein PilN
MRAVNLLPSDLRNVAPATSPSAGQEPRAEGIGAYVVLGALGLCVAMLAVYVLAANSIKQKQADLERATAEATVVAQQASALKPYADFDALAKARVETVRGLAAARFDWEQALGDLSRSVPSGIKLTSLSGDMGLPGASGGGTSDPLRGSIQAPAISLAGCAPDQPAVAQMLSRLRAVDGVTRVALSKSEAATAKDSATESPCKGKNPPSFSAVVFFERSAAIAAMAPAQANAATAPTVPVPNAVNGTPPAAGGTTPAAGGAAAGTTPADPAAGNSSAAAVNSSTTPTGATP